MRRWLLVVAFALLSGNAFAVDVAGVAVAPSVEVSGKTLALNGYGIRKKFFFKVYVGALYTSRRLSAAAELLQDPGPKLVRMHILLGKVEKEKITGTFAEGFANNAPDVAGSADARTFLAFFTRDFLKGDVVDLELGADGAVAARQNGTTLGTIRSAKLADAILRIYVGPKPACEELKKGMLRGL